MMAEEVGEAEVTEASESTEQTETTTEAPKSEAPASKETARAESPAPKAEPKAEKPAAKAGEPDWRDFITDKKFKEFESQILSEDTAAKERAVEEAQDALRKEWGKDYDGNVNIANRTMGQLANQIGV